MRAFAADAERAIRNLARLTEPQPVMVANEPDRGSAVLWFALGARASGAAFVLGRLLG